MNNATRRSCLKTALEQSALFSFLTRLLCPPVLYLSDSDMMQHILSRGDELSSPDRSKFTLPSLRPLYKAQISRILLPGLTKPSSVCLPDDQLRSPFDPGLIDGEWVTAGRLTPGPHRLSEADGVAVAAAQCLHCSAMPLGGEADLYCPVCWRVLKQWSTNTKQQHFTGDRRRPFEDYPGDVSNDSIRPAKWEIFRSGTRVIKWLIVLTLRQERVKEGTDWFLSRFGFF